MKRIQFKFESEVWKWPGFAGWHFITLPKGISAKIKKVSTPYGAGFVKVEVVVGKSTWITALFPHKDSDSYLPSIKKKIREKENIWEGDMIRLLITLI